MFGFIKRYTGYACAFVQGFKDGYEEARRPVVFGVTELTDEQIDEFVDEMFADYQARHLERDQALQAAIERLRGALDASHRAMFERLDMNYDEHLALRNGTEV
jgi:hypothetical protein